MQERFEITLAILQLSKSKFERLCVTLKFMDLYATHVLNVKTINVIIRLEAMSYKWISFNSYPVVFIGADHFNAHVFLLHLTSNMNNA